MTLKFGWCLDGFCVGKRRASTCPGKSAFDDGEPMVCGCECHGVPAE